MQFLISGLLTLCLLVLPILAIPVQNATLDTNDDSTPCHIIQQETNITNIMNTPNAIIDPAKRWPNNRVTYHIDGVFDPPHNAQIRKAMDIIQQHTCVRFVQGASGTRIYVHIVRNLEAGCASNVGYQGKYQICKLAMDPIGIGCFKIGIIIHELIHTLGCEHAHNAPDRDSHVKLFTENISPGGLPHFTKLDRNQYTDYGLGYDVESIMHYGPFAFSKNGLNTMRPYNTAARMGQREAMTAKDIAKLNYMYKC